MHVKGVGFFRVYEGGCNLFFESKFSKARANIKWLYKKNACTSKKMNAHLG